MSNVIDAQAFEQGVAQAYRWLAGHVLTLATLEQFVLIAACALAAALVAPKARAVGRRWAGTEGSGPTDRSMVRSLLRAAVTILLPLTFPATWLMLLWLALMVARETSLPQHILAPAVSLLAAWVAIHLLSKLIRDPFWSRLIRFIAWSVVALDIVDLLDDARASLDQVTIAIGRVEISPLSVLTAVLWLAVLLWLAGRASQLVERRFAAQTSLSPSVQLLFSRLVKVGLIIAAVFVALGSVGIDLTAFAVFSGAIGVGIGFGLQAIFNNFIAGIILLGERTLKEGDFVQLDHGVAGTVRRIAIRNTVLTTPDNVDIAVPNSEFVNGRLTNWTMLDDQARIHVPFPIAYGTDQALVERIVLEAARGVRFTLPESDGRVTQVWLVRFGESRMEYELVVWLTPEGVHRPAGAQAAYCRAIYGALRLHGLELPFPQRDLHLRSAVPLGIVVSDPAQDSGRSRREA